MKAIQIIKFTVSFLLILGTFTACVDDKDFDTPQVNGEDNDISNSSISAVKNNLIQGFDSNDPSTLIYTYPENSTVVISGYVIGDDASGNFYKELVIQDSPENPTAGIEIDINQSNLHNIYNVGRKIYIKMAGLSVGYFDGTQGGPPNYINQSTPGDSTPGLYKIGVKGDDFSLNRIASTAFESSIIRSSTTETIVPKIITSSDFNDDNMNTYIQMDNMQFELGELGKTFAGEQNDSFDAERILLSCDTDVLFGLMTSTFSDFKSIHLPTEKGTLKGVLTKNYRESSPVVVLNNYEDLDFTNTERCDPIILDCGLADTSGITILFEDDFETQSTDTLISGNGWTNYIQEGTQGFEAYTSGGTNASLGISARVGSYQSGDASSIAWLISPAIDLDAQEGETLEFKTSNSFSDGSTMKLLFSTDWDGTEANITSANWGVIPAAYIVDDSEFYGDWLDSGIVDLSCGEGTIYFAFKYNGSGDSETDGTFELDEIKLAY